MKKPSAHNAQRRKSRAASLLTHELRMKATLLSQLAAGKTAVLPRIQDSHWPAAVKEKVSQIILAAARNPENAKELAQPRIALPHNLLVSLYANTLFREFNRFFGANGQKKTIEEFMDARQPIPGDAEAWYGTKRESLARIKTILASKKIPKPEKKAVLQYLEQNNPQKMGGVQLHRVQHYCVGLLICAEVGLFGTK